MKNTVVAIITRHFPETLAGVAEIDWDKVYPLQVVLL
jgi:hypothetical protein